MALAKLVVSLRIDTPCNMRGHETKPLWCVCDSACIPIAVLIVCFCAIDVESRFAGSS